jgi:integrase/recombinase XerC
MATTQNSSPQPESSTLGRLEIPTNPNGAGPDAMARDWLDWLLNVRGRSPRTINTYGVVLGQWLKWCGEHKVRPLSPALVDLEQFVVRPRKRQGHGGNGSPSSRHTDVTVLKGWYGWCFSRGHLALDPTGELYGPTVPKGVPKPVPPKLWLAYWQSDLTPMLRIASGLAYFCGLRRRELCQLQGGQIDRTNITFVRKGGDERQLPWRQMVDVYAETMPELIHDADGFVDLLLAYKSQHKSRRMFWADGQHMYKAMLRHCTKLGIPQVRPHELRHSCASNLVNRAGVPIHIVAELLNHSSIDITRGYVASGAEQLDAWRRGVMAQANTSL